MPGIYNASPITLSDGQGAALALNSSGQLVSSIAANSSINLNQVAGSAVATGHGTAAGAIRVELPTDGTGLVGLNAGTNAIGKLAANSGVDIGDVDVTSVIPGTAATSLGKAVDSAAGATDTGVAALFVRRDTPTTLTPADADYARAGLDSLGSQWVREYYAPAYEDNTAQVAKVEQRFNYAQIAAGQATTTVKSGAGFLHAITLNSAATATNVTTVYDNTAGSGTVIAIPAATTATIPVTLFYDVSFSTGLTIVTATANGSNMTVSYR